MSIRTIAASLFMAFALWGCGSTAVIQYVENRPVGILDDANSNVVARRSEYRFSFSGFDNGSQVIRLWAQVHVDGEPTPILLPAVSMSSLFPAAGTLTVAFEEPSVPMRERSVKMAVDGSYYSVSPPGDINGVVSDVVPTGDYKGATGDVCELLVCKLTYTHEGAAKKAIMRFLVRPESLSGFKMGQKPIWENGSVVFR